jgi:hypothetical protein
LSVPRPQLKNWYHCVVKIFSCQMTTDSFDIFLFQPNKLNATQTLYRKVPSRL